MSFIECISRIIYFATVISVCSFQPSHNMLHCLKIYYISLINMRGSENNQLRDLRDYRVGQKTGPQTHDHNSVNP